MRTRRTGLRTGVPGLVLVVLSALALLCAPLTSGALTGRVVNQTNTSAAAIFNTCDATTMGAGAYFSYPFNDAANATTAADFSGSARPGTYRNPAGITYGAPAPCPRDTTRAVTLNGAASTGGHITGPASVANPQTFSIQVWFRTTTTRGGKLIGLGNAATGASSTTDRHLYMTDAGRVVLGVAPNSMRTITTPNALNDNAWHQAVGTLTPTAGDRVGLRLYIDGALVATDTGITSAQNYSGFWRIGYDSLTSWPNAPTSNWFAGSLAWASVYTTALTPAQVAMMYQAGR